MKKREIASLIKDRRIFSTMIISLLVIMLSLFLFSCSNPSVSKIPEEIATSKNPSGYSSILREDDNSIVAAFYPIIKNEVIMNDLKMIVDQQIEQFDHDQYEIFYLDYDIYYVSDQYVSIVFSSGQADNVETLQLAIDQTLTYDLVSGQRVLLDDLLQADYLPALTALLRKTVKEDVNLNDCLNTDLYRNTKIESINLDKFVLDNDQLILFYDSSKILNEDDGLITISLSLIELNYYLKHTLFSNPIVEPSLIKNSTLRYIDPDKPMIALTYDDGPYSKVTDQILEALYDNNSAATFFIVGNRINNYSKTLETMINNGNEIGNHSYTHKYNLTKLDIDELSNELNYVQRDIDKYVKDYQLKLLRPTGGSYNQFVKDNCNYPLINWSVDTKDWYHHNSDSTYNAVVNVVKDGDIVLMHDLFQSTADATKAIVPKLVEMGYQLVTVSELFDYKGIDIQTGKVYFSSYSKTK